MNNVSGNPSSAHINRASHTSAPPLSVAMIGPVPAQWGGQKWTGGVANHIYGLTKAFDEERLQIGLLADNMTKPLVARPAGIPSNLDIHVLRKPSNFGFRWGTAIKIGLKLFNDPRHRQIAPLGYLLRLAWRATNMQMFLQSSPASLAHVHHARLRLFACWELLAVQKSLLSTVHSVNKLSDDSPQWLKDLIISNYKRANWFIAVSGFVRNEMVAHGADPDRITVIPNGVDIALFSPGSMEASRSKLQLPAKSFLVLFTGSLTVRKGVDLLLRAFKNLYDVNPAAQLVLVGEGPERLNLLQLAKELGIADRVIFAGPKLHPELPTWYQACDVYILPSWAEGLSLALLEAMASGKPVITTAPATGAHDAIHPGETGLLFQRGDVDGFTHWLVSLAGDPNQRGALGQAARKRVEAEFTWNTIAHRTLAVYRHLLKNTHP